MEIYEINRKGTLWTWDLVKGISGQYVESEIWLFLDAYGKVQEEPVEAKKELFRFQAEFRRTKKALELVGLIIKLLPYLVSPRKKFLKVKNGLGLRMKYRVLLVKYDLRVNVFVKASERFKDYLNDPLS